MTFDYLTLSEKETGNAVGRNLDADRGNQIQKLFVMFFYMCQLGLFKYIPGILGSFNQSHCQMPYELI